MKELRGECMGDVVQLNPKQHVYDVSHCLGCKKENNYDHIEVSFLEKNEVIKHVSFCLNCYEKHLIKGFKKII